VAVAVLGAGGFIGSKVAQALVDQGEEVLVVSHREPSSKVRYRVWEAARERAIVDLRNETVDLQGCTTVYNFAADMGGVGYFSQAQVGPYMSNSRITFNVLELAGDQNVGKLFMASSACAYPTQLQMTHGLAPRLSEDLLELGPPDQMYGREKLMVCALAQNVEFDCRVGILHTVYGDSETNSSMRMKFPTAIARKALDARQSGRIEIWGDGTQLRSYLWIDDAVSKILKMMEGDNPGPVNVGYQGAITVNEVVKICTDYLGISPAVDRDLNAPSGVLARDCSNELFWSLYGQMEPTDYVSGFGQLIRDLESQSQLNEKVE
jgi:GDP-D-mannose 3',5'-epimerase